MGAFVDALDVNHDGLIEGPEFVRMLEEAASVPEISRTKFDRVPMDAANFDRGPMDAAKFDRVPMDAGGTPRTPRSQNGGSDGQTGSAHPTPRPGDPVRNYQPDESEILEFLEGLLEGFRAVSAVTGQKTTSPGPMSGDWSDLDALAKAHYVTKARKNINLIAESTEVNMHMTVHAEVNVGSPGSSAYNG